MTDELKVSVIWALSSEKMKEMDNTPVLWWATMGTNNTNKQHNNIKQTKDV